MFGLGNFTSLLFFNPTFLGLVGAAVPETHFWMGAPVAMACHLGLGLIYVSRDVYQYGTFVYINGIARLVFGIFGFLYDYADCNLFIQLVTVLDLIVAVAFLSTLSVDTGRSHYQLLTNTFPGKKVAA